METWASAEGAGRSGAARAARCRGGRAGRRLARLLALVAFAVASGAGPAAANEPAAPALPGVAEAIPAATGEPTGATVSLPAEGVAAAPGGEETDLLPREDAPAPPPPGRTLRDWYALGGWVMHLLSLCSVLIVGGILERAWRLRRGAVAPRALEKAVRAAAESGNRSPLVDRGADGRSALARLVEAGLSAVEPIDRVESLGAIEAQRLRRNLPLIAALGNLATMLGLLGTVLGMIEAFELIAAAGVGDARVVAGGIFRALVTTAAGLGTGIGALSAHAFLSRKADDGIARLEELCGALFEGKEAVPTREPHAVRGDDRRRTG